MVRVHGVPAAHLDELEDGRYRLAYLPGYQGPDVSLTLPRAGAPWLSDTLPPFFAGLLSEGGLRALQHRLLHIDESDDLGLLLAAGSDLAGCVTVEIA